MHVLGAARASEEPFEPETKAELDERIARFVKRLVEAKFYGKLTLSFQNGKVTDLRTEQAMKIDEI